MPSSQTLSVLQETLMHLELTPKESRTYTVMLSMGAQSASVLARRMEMGRSSAQFIAESLVKKHLATKSVRHNITYYTPISPEEIPKIIERRMEEQVHHWQGVKKEMEDLMPELTQISQVKGGSPKIKSYEGKEGVKYVIEDVFKAEEELRTFFSYEGRSALFPSSYFDKCRARREAKGISVKAIYPDTPEGRKTYEKSANKELKKVHLVDHHKYHWEPEIRLYDNKVSFVSHQEQIGVIIESEMIADAMKVLFDLAWEDSSQD